MNYSLIEKNKIIDGPKQLPINWKNISNLPSLSNLDLRELGWLPVEYPIEDFDPVTQKRIVDTYNILPDKVIVIFNYEDKTVEEMAIEAMAAVQAAELNDMEAITYIKSFLKAKFGNDVLFPNELK
jgi:hypothetical protein